MEYPSTDDSYTLQLFHLRNGKNKDFHTARRFKANIESISSIIRVDLGVAEKATRLRAEKDIKLLDTIIISTSEIA